MTNKIAIVEEAKRKAKDGGMIIREAKDYFDKVFAVESKDLKFFFEDDEDVHHHLMYAYCMQGKFLIFSKKSFKIQTKTYVKSVSK